MVSVLQQLCDLLEFNISRSSTGGGPAVGGFWGTFINGVIYFLGLYYESLVESDRQINIICFITHIFNFVPLVCMLRENTIIADAIYEPSLG